MARMQEARETSTARRSPAAKSKAPTGENKQMLQDYQNALQLMQQGKFEKARAVFEKIVKEAPPEILERSRVYLTVCERNCVESSLSFKTPGEQYDYAPPAMKIGKVTLPQTIFADAFTFLRDNVSAAASE